MRFLRRLLARLRTRRFLDRLVRTKGEQLGAIRLSAAATRNREAHEQFFMESVASASPSILSARSTRFQPSIWTGDFYRAPSDTPVARKSLPSRFSFATFVKSTSLATSPSTNNSTLRLDELSPLVLPTMDEEADTERAGGGGKGDPFEMWDYVHPKFVRHSSLNEWV